jgi:NAD(P)-dependent dehydrogenase (short-subunit alcohol dehydrogenase family)
MTALAGRVVVVTGAGRGLGRAYAHDAAAAGAAVVVNDIDEAEAREVAAGLPQAVASRHDISDPEQAQELIALARERFGRLDGLVNNAGLYYEAAPWEDDPRRIHRLIDVNVVGSLLCTAVAARAFREQGQGGAIVNATSGALFGFPTTSTYSASKGAIASLTLSTAIDLAEIGVRVNAVAPVAATRLTLAAQAGRRFTPDGARSAPLDGIEARTPDRIAPLVTFLLSSLSDGITGRFYRFDGFRLSRIEFADPAGVGPVRRETWDLDGVVAAFRDSPELGPPPSGPPTIGGGHR